jgi:hypothetical protein
MNRYNTGMLALVMAAALSAGGPLYAQEVHGFAGAGVSSDINSRYPAFGGGVLVDLPTSWLSAGAEGDVFVSWPYFGGRGAVFGQANVLRGRAVRPFVLAGYGWGESAGPMIGGGLELRVHGPFGVRASVEDYLVRLRGFGCGSLDPQANCHVDGGRLDTRHQIATRFSLLF